MANHKSDKPQGLDGAPPKAKLSLVHPTTNPVERPMYKETSAFEHRLQRGQRRGGWHRPKELADYSTSSEASVVAIKKGAPYAPGRVTGPVQVFNNIINTWNVSQLEASQMLGFENTELAYVADILNGNITLRGRDPKDRIANLFVIRSSLASLFRNTKTENAWLREPQEELENHIPLDFLVDGAFEKLLRVRHLVDLMSGRI